MKKMIIATALALVTASIPLVGCEREPIDSLAIKRGINVSTLEYFGANKDLRIALRGGEFTREMVEDIKAQGFDHIRLPVNFGDNYENGNVTEDFFAQVDRVVDMILDCDLTVVLDFHGWEELKSDVGSNKEKFYDIWEEISEHYADYPNELLFEIFNEPYEKEGPDMLDAAKLNELQLEAVNIIRKTNPDRIIVLDAPEWCTWWGLDSLKLPENDPNIIVDVHTYQPLTFTHQGQELWTSPDPNFKSVGITQSVYDEIDTVVSTCKKFTERTGVRVWLGEFGMVTAIPEEGSIQDFFAAESKEEYMKSIKLVPPAAREDITAYLAYVTEKAEQANIPWAVWEYDFEFGAYNILEGEWRDYVMDGLMREDG